MKQKIRLYLIILTLLVTVASTAAGAYLAYNSLVKQTQATLKNELTTLLVDAAKLDGRRITHIAPDGKVLMDSVAKRTSLGSHADREEFIEATNTGEGYAVRRSDTVQEVTIYYALRMADRSVLRLAMNNDSVWMVLLDTLPVAIIMLLLLILAVSVLTGWLTRRIVEPM
jgi:two-component system phosphate regulon sensor histidine kinase PhoR